MKNLLVAALIAAVSVPAGIASAADANLTALLRGVKEVHGPGSPGGVSVFGSQAFAVVVGKSGKASLPVIGAAQAGRGRVVAFGHSGYLSAEAFTKADTGALLTNAVVWAGRATKPVVVTHRADEVATALKQRGFTVRKGGLKELTGAQVLVLGSLALSDAEAATVRQFVNSGGGLLAAATGWGWAQLNPGKSLVGDFAGNKLLAPWGLVWTGAMPGKTTVDGYKADIEPPPLIHAGRALDAVLAQSAAKTTLAKDAAAQAEATLVDAAHHLPPDDRLLLPRLQAMRRGAGASAVPGPKQPLKAENLAGRISVTLEGRELRAQSVEQVKPHPSAALFPGDVPKDAPRLVAHKVVINTGIPDWHGTGLYAAPGETITVQAPASALGQKLQIRIGAHKDTLWHLDTWRRFPEITRTVPVNAVETRLANPFGGLIYVEVPRAAKPGSLELSFNGAVTAPHYVHGRTSGEDWRKTIRQQPAPWGELETGKVVLTLPSSVLRALDDPAALMTTWDRVLDLCAELAAISPERARPERIVCDEQISAGYMHAGYPIMTHMDVAGRFATHAHMLKGDWGIFHELGHNHQVRDWTFDGTGEVTCNLFTMYVLDKLNGVKPAEGRVGLPVVAEHFRKHTAGGAPSFDRWKDDAFLALAMYVQLQHAFGWEPYQRVFAEYVALPDSQRPKDDDARRDQWMTRFSKAVNRNLGPFFQAWGVPVSEAALKSIAGLPAWPRADWPGLGKP